MGIALIVIAAWLALDAAFVVFCVAFSLRRGRRTAEVVVRVPVGQTQPARDRPIPAAADRVSRL